MPDSDIVSPKRPATWPRRTRPALEASEEATRLVLARTPSGKCELVSLAPAPSDALEGLDDAKELVAGSLGKVSQLSLPEVDYTNMAA